MYDQYHLHQKERTSIISSSSELYDDLYTLPFRTMPQHAIRQATCHILPLLTLPQLLQYIIGASSEDQ